FFILLAALLLFLGLVFREYLLANIVMPLATVVWLLLRIFVLSIDQQVYWWGLIALTATLALIRLFRSASKVEDEQPRDPNPALKRVTYWRTFIQLNTHEPKEKDSFRRELMWLLTSMYSSRQPGHANYEIQEAFKERQIPLPEAVYNFLFAGSPAAPRQSFWRDPLGYSRQLLQALHQTYRKWMRRWTRREAAEYYQAIHEVLTMMESSLEISYDDKPADHHDD
ncbi:MAG: hypothetical protein M1281_16580, partial [Chloroflexi bacterium]|nr:hypothetical protein [Chloroflexota bacterium]